MTPAAHRAGQPAPLVYHLSAAAVGYQAGLTVMAKSGAPEFPWHPELDARGAPLGTELDPLAAYGEILARLSDLARGLRLWQAHPYRRNVEDPETIWSCGSARLLDYGTCPEATAPDGPPVLVIPSLVNRAYILDLGPGMSLLRHLASQGLRPFLLDWGAPDGEELGFDLGQYCVERAQPAIDAVAALAGRKIGVLGYCMGGTLAVGIAATRPQHIAALATLGAPWDLAGAQGVAAAMRAYSRAKPDMGLAPLLDQFGHYFGAVPVSFFQWLFAIINPMQAAMKFRKFAHYDQTSPAAHTFAAIEDWLADGIPMAAPAAKNLLVDWFVHNLPAEGRWQLSSVPVDCSEIRVPSCVICGRSDTITPTAVAAPLGAAIPGAVTLLPHTGHVGMIVGSRAPSVVWTPLTEFLHANVA